MTMLRLEAHMAERLGLPPDADRAAFDAARADRLVAAVETARGTSPFYRRRRDWPRAPFGGPADLPRLPFTTPADLVRADPPLVAVSGGAVDRVVTLPTSGTSGLPKRLHFSRDDLEATIEFFRYGMGVFTRPGDRVAVAFPSDRPGGIGDGLAVALRRLGAVPLPLPAAPKPETIVAFLRAERPDVIAGAPVPLLAAARLGDADGGPPITLAAALLSSDHAAASLVGAIGRLWGADVHVHWGMTETGYGGAVDCPVHAGLHLREADLWVEVIDPQTGAVLPAGADGEIVVTTLAPRATPLLRYRTGDRGRLLDAPCACGSRLVRLAGLAGRIGDDVPLATGDRIDLPTLDEAIFAVPGVCDFEASFVGANPLRFVVELAAPPARRGPALVAGVRRALVGVPAIGRALAARLLDLDIELAEATFFPRTAKRRLHLRPAATSVA